MKGRKMKQDIVECGGVCLGLQMESGKMLVGISGRVVCSKSGPQEEKLMSTDGMLIKWRR